MTTFRIAVRSLLRRPGLNGVLLLIIAVGIGSNTAIYGFVRGLATAMPASGSPGIERISLLLHAAAGAVFAATCANVAGVLLTRASARATETAVKQALGATRWQLAHGLLTDGVLVATAGGALGGVAALWTVAALPAAFFESDARELVSAPDRLGMAAATVAAAAIIVACGLTPLAGAGDDPGRIMQRESAGGSRRTRRLRAGLVIAQIACGSMLVIAAAMLGRSLQSTLQTHVGQALGDAILVTVQAVPRASRGELLAEGAAYFAATEREARSVPGVSAAAWIARPPGSLPVLQSLSVEPPSPAWRDALLSVEVLSPRSLRTVVLPPAAGRMFGGNDRPDSCPAVLVNETAARLHFGGSPQAVGRLLEDQAGRRIEIVGVVANTTSSAAAAPTVYYYASQATPALARTGPQPFRITEMARSARATLDVNIVSPAYFETIGWRPVAGTLPGAVPERACRVAVIDQQGADQYFDGHAVGGAVIDAAGRRTTIVGVVSSAVLGHWQRVRDPVLYVPASQNFLPRMTLFLRSETMGAAMLSRLHDRIRLVPGGKDDSQVTRLSTHLHRTALAPQRIASVLLSAAAAIALAVCMLGVYGLIAEATRQRRREIALRIALGASRWTIFSDVLGTALRLWGAGAVAGIAGALVVRPWLSVPGSVLAADDWQAWLVGPAAALMAVVTAAVVPAWRAFARQPLALLRDV